MSLPIAGCSDPAAEQLRNRPTVIDTLRVELPFGDEEAEYDDKPALAINEAGEFEVKGSALSPEELSSYLSEQRVADTDYLSVRIDDGAKFGDVIARLSPIAEETEVYVAQTTGGTFRPGQVKLTDPLRERLFVSEIGLYDLPLIASHLPETDQCVLLLGGGGASILEGRPLGSSELAQFSTKLLDRYVEHYGGADAVADNPDVAGTLVARIQAEADTPWRCVAAPIERARQVGWRVFQYELVP
ncbi:MAG: hypothetical protein AAF687_10185 [Pseudomonadota bacterium]